MAQIVIKDILGSDNMASSRPDIASNFKILADEANKIETFLNTSTTGGSLTIGTTLIKKYSRPITDVIFNCEGTGVIAGNLTLGTIGQTTSVTVNSIVNINDVTNFSSNVNLSGADKALTVGIKTLFGDALIVSRRTSVNPTPESPLVSTGSSTASITWNTTTQATIENGVDGQILILHNVPGTFASGALTLKNAVGTTIATISATPTILGKLKLILQFASATNAWEVISVAGITDLSQVTI
ncbi:MAG: hypothetical protein WC979_01545 [Candidatus Pacearchaeota archaeon]|jgi:hypothetical protein|nr:hypothetical protein [Clostridia bacterium]